MNALTGSALAIELISLTGQRWITSQSIASLVDKFGVHGVQKQIQFLTGVKIVLRQLPVEIFEDPDARQTLLSAAQEALDAAIDQEDDE